MKKFVEKPTYSLWEWVKVEEEYQKFLNAKKERSTILMLVTLSGLYGALQRWADRYNPERNSLRFEAIYRMLEKEVKEVGLVVSDLQKFSEVTNEVMK